MHAAYKCWVPDCSRAFSRTDNLKSHLRNTHSKRPGVRGNRYVATLDKTSDFYDPEWVGELDKNGYPVS
jgi:zinc finger protein BrlA